MDKIYSFLAQFKATGQYPEYITLDSAGTEPEVIIEGKKCLLFCSNNYLGLSKNPEVIKAAIRGVENHGIGPGGSRILSGNIRELNELDTAVASLVGKEDAITFPTGYMANAAIFKALMDPLIFQMPYGKGDGVIISDEYNHYSILEGCRISYSKKVVYKHNDINDLENKLIENKGIVGNKIVVTEGVFSMEGEISPLKEILSVTKAHGFSLMVDDAHGLGVFGDQGGGIPQELGIEKDIDILMGTLDKAIGGMGGFLAGNKVLIDYLRIASRPYLFSSAVSGVMAYGVIKAIEIVKSRPELRRKVLDNAYYLKNKLQELGFTIYGDSNIPAVPVKIGNENLGIKVASRLRNYGIFTPIVRWPAVPKGESRVRITIMATHTRKHIDELINVLSHIGKSEGLI